MNISREMMNEMNTVYAGLDEKHSEIACSLTHRIFKLRSGWFNGHYYRKDDGSWRLSYCPIPEVDVIDLCDVEIHFDKIVVTTKLKRETTLAYSFEKLADYRFEAYGVEEYLNDFYRPGETVKLMKDRIAASDEKEIGFSFEFPFETEGEQIFEFVKLLRREGFYY